MAHTMELSHGVMVLCVFLLHMPAACVHVWQGCAEEDERDCSRMHLSVSICLWMGTAGCDVQETKTMARSAGTGRSGLLGGAVAGGWEERTLGVGKVGAHDTSEVG